MDLGLNDRIAFIAGASRGLGAAIARRLLAEGARVAICSRDADAVVAAASAASAYAHVDEERVLPLVCDVTDDTAVARAIDATVARFGRLNILVANAGGPPAGPIDEFDTRAWQDALALNLLSTISLTRAALPHLRRSAQESNPLARILMITSLAAKQPVAGLCLSNVARAGVQGFAKTLAGEVGPEGITVNTILPGYTRTDRLVHLAETMAARRETSVEAVESEWAGLAALRRIGTEDEFAAAAAFLVSQPASFITGVALPVDGGAIKSLF